METELPPDSGSAPDPAPEPLPEPAAIVPLAVPVPAIPVAAVPAAPESSPFADRGTGLVVFGIFQIILGLLAALMVPLVALGAFISRLAPGGHMRPGQFLSGVATYSSISAALLALGIGSLQMKRWARALTLVTSWYWLITGALVTVLLTAVLPVTMKGALAQMKQSGPNAPSAEMSAGIMASVLTLIIVFMAFFLVVVPIAFVVFYSRRDVDETCRRRDPVERWTDKTPLPVLGASTVLLVGALYLLLTGLTMPLFPFFGRYLTGAGAALCFFVTAAIDAYLAVALFRLQPSGWWIAALTVPFRLLSMAITYAKADVMQAYSKMGLSDAQLQMMNSNPMLRGHVLLWWSLLSMVFFFCYLLWLKRYFRTLSSTPAAALPAQVS